MITAINELEKAKDTLDKAISLAKEGTLESLLQYYKVGNDEYGHLPTHTTKYEKGIMKELVDLLNKEIKGTGFIIKSKSYLPSDVYIYIDSKTNDHLKDMPLIKELADQEFQIGKINVLEATITHSENIVNKYTNAVNAIQETKQEFKQEINTLNNLVSETLFFINKKRNKIEKWYKRKDIELKEKIHEQAKHRIELEKQNYAKNKKYYENKIDTINLLVNQIHNLYEVTDKYFKCENKISVNFKLLTLFEKSSDSSTSFEKKPNMYISKQDIIVIDDIANSNTKDNLKPYVIPNGRLKELLLCANTQKVEVEKIEFEHKNYNKHLDDYYEVQVKQHLKEKTYTKLGFYCDILEKEGFTISRLKAKHENKIVDIHRESHIIISSNNPIELSDMIDYGLMEVILWRKK